MSDRGAWGRPYRQGERPGLFETIAARFNKLRETWISSLTTRVMVIIMVSGILAMLGTGVIIINQAKSSVFDQAVNSNLEQFASEAASAQDRFVAPNSPTAGQSQQVANDLVATMYDPARGLMGAVLMREQNQDTAASQIIEPSTASATRVRSLVTPELRDKAVRGAGTVWQSVEIEDPNGTKVPGIVVGTVLTIPGAGDYEFFAAYTLANQDALLQAMFRVLILGIVGVIFTLGITSYILMKFVLRPIKEASKSAHDLAEGEFESRMEVRGDDELAQLAKSFNQMASSLEEQFGRMQRMSKVQTDFVSAVSHELRSPVTTIRMAGQLIYDKREDLPSSLKRSAELQHIQLINLDTMLSDLLEISRYDAGAMSLATEPDDIADIARDVIQMASPLATDNGVTVTFEATGDTVASVESRRIERIIRNLVVNALEHAEGNPVHVLVKGGKDAVAVLVEDHGIGLSPEQAEHVFDRFWRADSARVRKAGGTGLGLTIAKEDANLHGGTLEATGEIGVGSAFLLTIPRETGAAYSRPLQLQVPTPLPAPPEPEVAAPTPIVDVDEHLIGSRGPNTAEIQAAASAGSGGPATGSIPALAGGAPYAAGTAPVTDPGAPPSGTESSQPGENREGELK